MEQTIGDRLLLEAYDKLLPQYEEAAKTDKAVEFRLQMWVADCAAHVLHLFEKQSPNDARPRRAIEARRAFYRGQIDAAARDAAWAAARAAARDAAGAAARAAAGDAAWDAAWDAAGAAAGAAARAAAWDAARAAAGAAAWDAAWRAERKWQALRLAYWMNDSNPTELKEH